MNRTSKQGQARLTGILAAALLAGCQGGEAERPPAPAEAQKPSGARAQRASESCPSSGTKVTYEETSEGVVITSTNPEDIELARDLAIRITQGLEPAVTKTKKPLVIPSIPGAEKSAAPTVHKITGSAEEADAMTCASCSGCMLPGGLSMAVMEPSAQPSRESKEPAATMGERKAAVADQPRVLSSLVDDVPGGVRVTIQVDKASLRAILHEHAPRVGKDKLDR